MLKQRCGYLVCQSKDMRQRLTLLTLFLSLTIVTCRKKNTDATDCFSHTPTVRKIVNKSAVVKVTATIYDTYLVEQGTIDTKLIPCNLPQEFMQNDLLVVITGDVKQTTRVASEPCCADNFVIERITR